jgi:inosine/xanthosine triphosphate pyrophosphatase family protein
MKPVVFITANQSKHAEVDRLLAGIDVRWERLGLPRPPLPDLESIARARVAMAYEQLGVPCFLEATGLFLYDHDGAPGASFKRLWRELGEAGFAKRFGGSQGVARVVVALAEGPDAAKDIRVFSGQVSGTLVSEPRGNGYGWANIWQPDGYDRTLGEMGASTYVVNMRAHPYLELGDHLRGQRFTGTFEAHVTVRLQGAEAMDTFRAACTDLGVKNITIELPQGETPTQPMTASFHRGELRDVQGEVLAISRELVRRGLEVTRTKIEAHGPAHDVPETDEAAARAPTTSYFEFHIKLALPENADLGALTAVCQQYQAHLSRNAHKGADSAGMVERFVTLRVHRAGRPNAEAKFAALCEAVSETGFTIRNRIREYTVFDTNVSLDKGWLPSQ